MIEFGPQEKSLTVKEEGVKMTYMDEKKCGEILHAVLIISYHCQK